MYDPESEAKKINNAINKVDRWLLLPNMGAFPKYGNRKSRAWYKYLASLTESQKCIPFTFSQEARKVSFAIVTPHEEFHFERSCCILVVFNLFWGCLFTQSPRL